MRDAVFSLVASRFSTELISSNKWLAAVWRVLFYIVKPQKPFVMKTKNYSLVVHPHVGTLTRAVIRRGHWEPVETDVLKNHIGLGSFVIDAGANFGHYSLVSSGIVGEEGLVIAFEPDPFTYNLLKQNISLLKFQNVVAEQAGLGLENAQMSFAIDDDNPGGHSFCAANVLKLKKSEKVKVYALDRYIEEKKISRKLDLIKIDVQGFEWKLISGAVRTIKQDRPVVFCEVTPASMANVGDSFSALLDFFCGLGYKVAYIKHEGMNALSYENANRILSDENTEYLDMVFLP